MITSNWKVWPLMLLLRIIIHVHWNVQLSPKKAISRCKYKSFKSSLIVDFVTIATILGTGILGIILFVNQHFVFCSLSIMSFFNLLLWMSLSSLFNSGLPVTLSESGIYPFLVSFLIGAVMQVTKSYYIKHMI